MSAATIPPEYRDMIRRAASGNTPFKLKDGESGFAHELADAGFVRAAFHGGQFPDEVLGVTVKGREWLESRRRARWAWVLAFLRELLILAFGAAFGALASRYITPSAKCDSPCVCEPHPVCQKPDEKSNGEENCHAGEFPP